MAAPVDVALRVIVDATHKGLYAVHEDEKIPLVLAALAVLRQSEDARRAFDELCGAAITTVTLIMDESGT